MNPYLEAPAIVAAVTGVLSSVTTIIVILLQRQTQRSIKTNHGSKNIGDAIDRLTDKVSTVQTKQVEQGEQILDVRERQTSNALALQLLDEKLDAHLVVERRAVQFGSIIPQQREPHGEAG